MALKAAEELRASEQGSEARMIVLGAYFDPGRPTPAAQIPLRFDAWKVRADGPSIHRLPWRFLTLCGLARPQDKTSTASITDFSSSRTNMGMVVEKGLWSLLVGCAPEFCNWDDYNWDWSFQVRESASHTIARGMRRLTCSRSAALGCLRRCSGRAQP